MDATENWFDFRFKTFVDAHSLNQNDIDMKSFLRYDTIVDADNLVKPDSDRRTVSNNQILETSELQEFHSSN